MARWARERRILGATHRDKKTWIKERGLGNRLLWKTFYFKLSRGGGHGRDRSCVLKDNKWTIHLAEWLSVVHE